MGRFVDQNDPSRLLADLTSDEGEKPSKSRSTRYANRTRSDVRKARVDRPAASQQRPADVSERVWGLTDQFLEHGERLFDRKLPVNRAKFAQRLTARVNHDEAARKILQPREWDRETRRVCRTPLSPEEFEKAAQQVNDILAEMIEVFYANLESGDDWDSWLDRKFLDCWSELWYRASQNLEVRALVDGLSRGTVSRRPANYKMADPEKIRSRQVKRSINRYLREHPNERHPDRDPITDEQRSEFQGWVAERKGTRDSVAN